MKDSNQNSNPKAEEKDQPKLSLDYTVPSVADVFFEYYEQHKDSSPLIINKVRCAYVAGDKDHVWVQSEVEGKKVNALLPNNNLLYFSEESEDDIISSEILSKLFQKNLLDDLK